MREGGFRDDGDWIKGIGTCPVRFEGEEGWVEAGDSGRLEVSDPKLLEGFDAHEELAGVDPVYHARNFLDCVRSRKDPYFPVDIGHRVSTICHLANIAIDRGVKLKWDPAKEQFVGDAAANAMCKIRDGRGEWKIR